MAESGKCSAMSEIDITAIKDTLQTQQQLLQKLYIELDEEREASSTAASEALSMILRLQGEKAAVQMEASQYKRLAEERMSYVENSLSVFEDVINQKEMEIASLEFQVQAHKWKLLSMGCGDLGAYESRFPEHPFLQRNYLCKLEIGANTIVRRLNSLPPIQLKDSYQKQSNLEREISGIPLSDFIPKIVKLKADQEFNVQNMDLEKKAGNYASGTYDSYWEQIRKLDERVKEVSDCKGSGRDNSASLKSESMTCSLFPQVSIDKLCDQTSVESITNLEQVKLHEHRQESEAIVNYPCSSSVQDILEVPQNNEKRKAHDYQEEWSKLILEGENRVGKPDLVSEDPCASNNKDETEWTKKMLHCENHDNKLIKARNRASDDCNVSCFPSRMGVSESQASFQQLCQRIERLEGDRHYFRKEISEAGEEEGLNLLKEIHEQLNMIQTEVRSWRTKKSPPQDEQPLLSLTEAMLYFWI
ncbi:hypothetical protein I3842_16G103900 [Carya illinoinensis]|uniref:GTD-binding domain-containing protein n=1 Tax=Carya illinoinensis TaxID=32201 RepID=A0A922D1B9_CARIL|nr:hypothetical protein I3842_16G103900 [Carya illinoinensis]